MNNLLNNSIQILQMLGDINFFKIQKITSKNYIVIIMTQQIDIIIGLSRCYLGYIIFNYRLNISKTNLDSTKYYLF